MVSLSFGGQKFNMYSTAPFGQKTLAKFAVGALFAGMGGFCVGFRHKNFETLWASDINKACRVPYEANFGNQNTELKFGEDGDIRKLSGLGDRGLTPVDVLHAGFPCQSFSVAGRREGFNDTKGNGRLMFEIFRLIEEWSSRGANYRPRIIVLRILPISSLEMVVNGSKNFAWSLRGMATGFQKEMLSKLTRKLTLAWSKIESAFL